MEKSDNIKHKAAELGISRSSLEKMMSSLGREPNELELKIYDKMSSESISYKSSAAWISQFSSKNEHVLSGAGENSAGIIDIGDGNCCVFKMGTHNHPSGIEPYNGASSCVTDIYRDVLSVGVKPSVVMKTLRFGDSSLDSTRWLMKETLKGISDCASMLYMNDIGTKISHHESYNSSPVVSVMVAGVAPKSQLLINQPLKINQSVLIIGAKVVAEGFDKHDEYLTIAKANPDTANLLGEAVLELNHENLLVRIENMDMAGVVTASCAICCAANVAMDIHIRDIPSEIIDVTAEQLLLDRTQERLMLVADAENVATIKAIAKKYDIACEQIGTLREGKSIRFFDNDTCTAEIIPSDLKMGFSATAKEQEYQAIKPSIAIDFEKEVPEPDDYWRVIDLLMDNPNLKIKEHLKLYVEEERNGSPSDAQPGVLLTDGKVVSFTMSGNSGYSSSNAFTGMQIDVAQTVRRMICSGAKPMALNNCLNLGTPANIEVFSDFVAAVKGLLQAEKFFNTPVVGGNVSFYNESSEQGKRTPILPTPIITMMGVLAHKKNNMSYMFRNKGDMIFLIGESRNDLAGSEYLATVHHLQHTGIPYFNLEEEKQINSIVEKLIDKKFIDSAHSIERGGLFFALLESSMPLGLGFDVTSPAEIRMDSFLFGESQGRVLVSVSMENEEPFLDLMIESGVPFSALGHITKGECRIDDISYGFIDEFRKKYQKSKI